MSTFLTRQIFPIKEVLFDSLSATPTGNTNNLYVLSGEPYYENSQLLYSGNLQSTTGTSTAFTMSQSAITEAISDSVGSVSFIVWAEESSVLSTGDNNGFQWSFGNGDLTDITGGIPIPVSCEVKAMMLDLDGGTGTVQLYINGSPSSAQISRTGAGQSVIEISGVALSSGDTINFRTVSPTSGGPGTGSRVGVYLESQSPKISGYTILGASDVSGSFTSGETLIWNGTSFINGTAGLTSDEVVEIAEGLISIFESQLSLKEGQLGLTTSFIAAPPGGSSPTASIVSLADNNELYINDSFINFGTAGFNLGDVYNYDATQGDVIISTKGHTGTYRNGNNIPFELSVNAFADRKFFFNQFRTPGGSIFISNQAVRSIVNVYGPNPTVNADGTSPDVSIFTQTLNPNQTVTVITPSIGEYYLLATQPVTVAVRNGPNQDPRTIPYLSTILIGHGRLAQFSALYTGTSITVRSRAGNTTTFTASPGSPADPILPDEQTDYQPDGFSIAYATGPINAFSGADSSGVNATQWWPIDALSQRFAFPYPIQPSGNEDATLAVASPYIGTARVYDGVTDALKYTIELTRNSSISTGTTADLIASQQFPAAGRIVIAGSSPAINAGDYMVSDVPCYVIANYEGANNDSDETNLHGIILEEDRAEIRKDVDGVIRVRTIDDKGYVNWRVGLTAPTFDTSVSGVVDTYIVQSTGNSVTNLMSQSAITEAIQSISGSTGSSLVNGTTVNSLLRWDGSDWVETTTMAINSGGIASATGDTAVAWGNSSQANALQSTAWGFGTLANASQATAFGNSTIATGIQSTAWGFNTQALFVLDTVWGNSTIANGGNATAWGDNTLASGLYSTAFGEGTQATGTSSTAWGLNTIAGGLRSTAFGDATQAIGDNSVAWGANNTSSGIRSTAFGVNTLASGNQSLAFGNNTNATDTRATAWGNATSATSQNATAWGTNTLASGNRSTAFGDTTTASAYASTSFGLNTNANSYLQTTIGGYSIITSASSDVSWVWTDELFKIGNGLNATTGRSDAFIVYKNATIEIPTARSITSDTALESATTANVGTVTNRLYNIGGELYWNGEVLATGSTSTDALTLSGQSPSFYLDRANHTGTQLSDTISNFSASTSGVVDTYIVQSTGTSLTSIMSQSAVTNALQSIDNTLSGLTDVTVTTPTNGQVLLYNAGAWENGPLNALPLPAGIDGVDYEVSVSPGTYNIQLADDASTFAFSFSIGDALNLNPATDGYGIFYVGGSVSNYEVVLSNNRAGDSASTRATLDRGFTLTSHLQVGDIHPDATAVNGMFRYNPGIDRFQGYENGAWVDFTSGSTDALTLSGQSPSFYLDRANHTGTQLSDTISNFSASTSGVVDTYIVQSTGTSLTSIMSQSAITEAINSAITENNIGFVVDLFPSSTAVTIDFSAGDFYNVYLSGVTGNFTLDYIGSNLVGTSKQVRFIQGSAARQLTFASGKFSFPFGISPQFSIVPNNIELLTFSSFVNNRYVVVQTPSLTDN